MIKFATVLKRFKILFKLLPIFVAAVVVGFGGWQVYKNVAISDSEIVTRAVEAFTTASTVHTDMDISIETPESDEVAATSTKITAASDIDLAGNSQNAHMVFGISGVSAEIDVILLKNEDFYVKMPFLFPEWLEFNPSELAESSGLPLDFKSLDYASQTKSYLNSLDLNSLQKVGEEIIDDKKVVHYKMGVSRENFEKYLKELSIDDELLEGFKNSKSEADIWINRKENQVVQMEIRVADFEVNEPLTNKSLGKSNMTIKVKYSKYNQTLDIKKPDGKIISYEELQREGLPFIPEAR